METVQLFGIGFGGALFLLELLQLSYLQPYLFFEVLVVFDKLVELARKELSLLVLLIGRGFYESQLLLNGVVVLENIVQFAL